MCGIAGILGTHKTEDIIAMLRVMKHRGPDNYGIYDKGSLGIGHDRLSIIDLSENGNQPMSNEDGNIQLVINGEIYNYKELRQELQDKGHQFRSNSDSEVLVHLYEEYGPECLTKINGMFAFAIYDGIRKRLMLARDRMGEKPLYYYIDHDRLIFASEIKSILQAGVQPELNYKSLHGYLAYQYTRGEHTMFNGIKRLLAGHCMVIEKGTIQNIRYWDINPVRYDYESMVLSKMRLRALLDKSVKMRLAADVPVGAFLSGGIDSSAIVALARQYHTGDFHTYSVGFETFSELPNARAVSQYLGTINHELIITEDMVERDIERIAWHFDEPMGEGAVINNYYMAKAARENVKVVLAGEGGDELFGGYQHYQIGLKYHWCYELPAFIRKAGGKVLDLMPGKGNSMSVGGRLHHLGSYFFQDTFAEAHEHTLRTMTDEEIEWLTGSQVFMYGGIHGNKGGTVLEDMLIRDCKNLLSEKFLMKADKATMALSIEERLPFLDPEVVECAFSIRKENKISDEGVVKSVLRESVADLLPKNVIYRKKQTFSTPLKQWMMKGQLRERVLTALNDGKLINEVINRKAVNQMVDIINGKKEFRLPYQTHFTEGTIWTLFALQLWHDIYFGGGYEKFSC